MKQRDSKTLLGLRAGHSCLVISVGLCWLAVGWAPLVLKGMARNTKNPTMCPRTILCREEFFCSLSDFFFFFFGYMNFKLFYPDIFKRWKILFITL